MLQLYNFLLFFELIPLSLFAVCLFIDHDKPWNFCARVFAAISLVILNIVQMILEIMLEYNYWLSVMLIFIWGIDLLSYYLELKKGNFKLK